MSCEFLWAFNSHIWQPTKRQVLLALSSLCQEEVDRINQFRFKDDFKLCLAGRLMIRKCIQLATNIKWNEINLARSTKGKPILQNELCGRKKFFFNISHQGDYTVLAASTKINIGIDVMKFVQPNNTDIQSFFKLMKRQFVDSEWSYILSHENEWKNMEAFYRMWCLKESYVKATGTGIGTNTASYMSFDVSDDDWIEQNNMNVCKSSKLFIGDKPQPWKFQEYQLDNKHILAVALDTLNDTEFDIPFHFVTIEELLTDAVECHPQQDMWWQNFQAKHIKR
ncbi:L-aminoadipate-semialdehyde dehydrogenase-phosphopantetheinyl transferase-like [Clytia hemisphaerica]|uniref:L-aminoadipate-semialdehyde dehydrogenase-phosphopantetheinyl transferase-like n=1 Tax=Clytia hemisphaerica TaxID=252671 RepID=UPI0034D73E1F